MVMLHGPGRTLSFAIEQGLAWQAQSWALRTELRMTACLESGRMLGVVHWLVRRVSEFAVLGLSLLDGWHCRWRSACPRPMWMAPCCD